MHCMICANCCIPASDKISPDQRYTIIHRSSRDQACVHSIQRLACSARSLCAMLCFVPLSASSCVVRIELHGISKPLSRVKGKERNLLYRKCRKGNGSGALASIPVAELHLFARIRNADLGNVEGRNGVVGRMVFVSARSRVQRDLAVAMDSCDEQTTWNSAHSSYSS